MINSDLDLCDTLEHRANSNATKLAYGFLSNRGATLETVSYGDLFTRVRQVASEIDKTTRKTDTVVCALPAGIDFIIGFFGILWSGRVAVPLSPPRNRDGNQRFLRFLDSTKPGALLMSGSDWAALDGKLAIPTINTDGSYHGDPDFKRVYNETAYLQFTSGSIRAPKGVVVTHENIVSNSCIIRRAFRHDESSTGVIWLPPYHDMGLVGGIIQPLFVGFPVYLMDARDFLRRPVDWLDAIERFNATTSGGPNFAYDMCVRRIKPEVAAGLDLTSWRVAFNGAERVSAKTMSAFAEKFEKAGFRRSSFTPCYGLAEATLMVSCVEPKSGIVVDSSNENEIEYVSCGPVADGITVAIVDPVDLTPLEEGEKGEILCSGRTISPGYWLDDEASSGTFVSTVKGFEGVRFLRTGDLGYFLNNELFVCGRLHSTIVVRGVNHSLEDIEHTASNAAKPIQGCRSAAFEVKDDNGNPSLVILQEAPAPVRKSSSDSVVESIRERVTHVHGIVPSDVRLVASKNIPKTRSGKVIRDACRSSYLEALVE